MTIRKLWLFIIISVVIISISINALILSSLTDKYFKSYLTENYDHHINQIITYTEKTLTDNNTSFNQVAIELETHLDDPITKIKLYDENGQLLVEVKDDSDGHGNMMNRNMMNNSSQEEVDQYVIENNGETIGILNITRHSSAENSSVARMFKSSLIKNSVFSIAIALFISIIVGTIVSRKMSVALKETADFASDIQVGIPLVINKSSITEINTIRESLEHLSYRLKIKQKNRKTLIDEMMHQSRTPLTILKSHLEAFEDGIIDINEEELLICQNQIDNITDIISNVGGMIDANTEIKNVKIEEFEFNHMVKQIIKSLQAQFDNKGIRLDLVSDKKIKISTDKYKLSQAIYNILTNAYKYTNKNGVVTVDYYVKDDSVFLGIKDTGIGIEEIHLDKIFDAYYRGDIDSPGEGIGLYIVRENIEMIKGDIQVSTRVNEGSNFILEIPVKY